MSQRQKATKDLALQMLQRRPLSEAELRNKLQAKGCDPSDVEDAIASSRDYNYIDDSALAASVVRESQRRGRGPLWVRQTLRRRQIADKLTENAVQTCQIDAMQRAHSLILRRFGDPTALPLKERQRARRFLLARGFLPEDAAEASRGAADSCGQP